MIDFTAQNLASAKSVMRRPSTARARWRARGSRTPTPLRGALPTRKRRPTGSPWSSSASRAIQLTRFSSSTIDADDSLRVLGVDSKSGTALYDAVGLSTRMLSTEQERARVLVLLTDGLSDVSSKSSLYVCYRRRYARRACWSTRSAIAASDDARAALGGSCTSPAGGTYPRRRNPSALRSVVRLHRRRAEAHVAA